MEAKLEELRFGRQTTSLEASVLYVTLLLFFAILISTSRVTVSICSLRDGGTVQYIPGLMKALGVAQCLGSCDSRCGQASRGISKTSVYPCAVFVGYRLRWSSPRTHAAPGIWKMVTNVIR